jgi:ribosome maturation factor RimP
MAKRRIEDIVTEIALPVALKNSYELVDVEYVKEGGNWFLRVYIDKPGGITVDDCQIVSEDISSELDKLDPVQQSDFFEVSSPGLDRPLKKDSDFEKYKGELIEIKLYNPIEGKKSFEGELLGLDDGKILIKDSLGIVLEFEREKAAIVRRVIKF